MTPPMLKVALTIRIFREKISKNLPSLIRNLLKLVYHKKEPGKFQGSFCFID